MLQRTRAEHGVRGTLVPCQRFIFAVALGERHGASRRWCPEPAASALPLTVRRVADGDGANHESHELHECKRKGAGVVFGQPVVHLVARRAKTTPAPLQPGHDSGLPQAQIDCLVARRFPQSLLGGFHPSCGLCCGSRASRSQPPDKWGGSRTTRSAAKPSCCPLECDCSRNNSGGPPRCDLNVTIDGHTYGRAEGMDPTGINPIHNLSDVDKIFELIGFADQFFRDRYGRNGANHHGGLGNPHSPPVVPWTTSLVYAYALRPADWMRVVGRSGGSRTAAVRQRAGCGRASWVVERAASRWVAGCGG